MKLEFRLGYVHLLVWLIKYKLDSSIGTGWNKMANEYNIHWSDKDSPDLLKPAAEKIVGSLKKL